MIRVRVQSEPIDVGAALAEAEAEGDGAGAVASFTGLVRADDGVSVLELEHYPGMTEAALAAVAEAAVARWSLIGVTVIHRVGAMQPGDRVVFVAACARHRGAALEACASVIDRLKTDAPFWKREHLADGQRWVEPRLADDAAAERWR